ncbi:hypothetical protein LJ737_17265 [Hymenobacter sp. 15J16-1T3B]|uniref:hypothetical protein n=1 Tax=Hymenobacter sp. 15J16-1T3B TaxID=2886941 RepID=UPI001D12CB8B|nr:hypothetical protein [Hymenobacter sp. 15J16-1T3B]MCC3158996.1 hypothetical protein [Hymenobacter sp. 15J16-1T3B]
MLQSVLVINTVPNAAFLGPKAKQFAEQLVDTCLKVDGVLAFSTLLGSDQKQQRSLVQGFQHQLAEALNQAVSVGWRQEERCSPDYDDAYDLYLSAELDGLLYKVVIELDKNRADQIAKKFISRVAHTIDAPTIYVAFCYPGTAKMNMNEAKKYFGYCARHMNQLSKPELPKAFIGIVMEGGAVGVHAVT